MLENLLHELGYAALDTECLAVILYLVLSAQLCLLLSWRWNAPANRRTNNTAATRKGALILSTYTAVLRLILLVEACLVLYGIAKAWTSLLWDITLVATVQVMQNFHYTEAMCHAEAQSIFLLSQRSHTIYNCKHKQDLI